MALRKIVEPSTLIGKALIVGALGSVTLAFVLSPPRPASHADDDVPLASTLSRAAPEARNADVPSAPRADSRSPASPDYNDAPADHSLAASTPAAPSGPAALSVRIKSSFADALRRLGIDANVTALLARSFARQIDFRRDLRKGDTISLVMPPANGADAAAAASDAQAPSEIPLAVRISSGDTDHDLFLHRGLNGKPFYYTADGRSGKPAFERYPLKFTRVSSNFAARRLDPFTHQWQSHDGVDLAAPIGTPVHATARGTISYAGWETGYGKIVVIDNAPPYQTAFAHLSRFAKGIHRGTQVRRGQVIGYVGQTGWATGPHLHYEVRAADVARDPLTVKLGGDTPLHGEEKKRFEARATRLAALL